MHKRAACGSPFGFSIDKSGEKIDLLSIFFPDLSIYEASARRVHIVYSLDELYTFDIIRPEIAIDAVSLF